MVQLSQAQNSTTLMKLHLRPMLLFQKTSQVLKHLIQVQKRRNAISELMTASWKKLQPSKHALWTPNASQMAQRHSTDAACPSRPSPSQMVVTTVNSLLNGKTLSKDQAQFLEPTSKNVPQPNSSSTLMTSLIPTVQMVRMEMTPRTTMTMTTVLQVVQVEMEPRVPRETLLKSLGTILPRHLPLSTQTPSTQLVALRQSLRWRSSTMMQMV